MVEHRKFELRQILRQLAELETQVNHLAVLCAETRLAKDEFAGGGAFGPEYEDHPSSGELGLELGVPVLPELDGATPEDVPARKLQEFADGGSGVLFGSAVGNENIGHDGPPASLVQVGLGAVRPPGRGSGIEGGQHFELRHLRSLHCGHQPLGHCHIRLIQQA